jgi:hypothetical protein
LVLDQASRVTLGKLWEELPVSFSAIIEQPAQWRLAADHVTLVLGPLPVGSALARLKGQRQIIHADAIGFNAANTVVALRVQDVARPDGKQAHLTLAVKGSTPPAESNTIQHWQPLPASLRLQGTLAEVPSTHELPDPTAGVTHLCFLDFDGTLVDTPEPEAGKAAWATRYGQPYPTEGWWGRAESLDPAIWPMKRVYQGYQLYRQQRALPHTKLVLLTNRVQKLAAPVKHLLDKHGYRLDALTFRQGSEDKATRIAHWLRAMPEVSSVLVADDMPAYLAPIEAMRPQFPHVTIQTVLIDRTYAHPGATAIPAPLQEALRQVGRLLGTP